MTQLDDDGRPATVRHERGHKRQVRRHTDAQSVDEQLGLQAVVSGGGAVPVTKTLRGMTGEEKVGTTLIIVLMLLGERSQTRGAGTLANLCSTLLSNGACAKSLEEKDQKLVQAVEKHNPEGGQQKGHCLCFVWLKREEYESR